ncbi:hypothetical protein AYI69_g2038 [Smittium culicis]|uniref:Uncharacterized protein n=1 Tax=Smittium culicis TaxID=133412 RepID=A0A1R1YNS5_9FUNG|nr:hypothetical protein AYI69_g2038 [Smittium culicis]
MEIDCNSDEFSNPEPVLLEEPTFVIMWNCCGSPLLLWSLEHTTDEDAHQCKRATDGTFCSEAQEGRGQIGVSLFRQHNHTLVHQEVRRHNLVRTIGDLRADLVTLPENQIPPKSNICTVTSEPRGCAEQTDGAYRMVHISEDIRPPEYTIWSSRRKSVCVPTDQIDDARIRAENGELHLAIVAPKEKRGDQPVENPCLISSHTDSIVKPVVAYKVYKEKAVFNLCPKSHENNSQ